MDGEELGFQIRLDKFHPSAISTIEYELSWGYPNAFLNRDDLHREHPKFPYNSVGLKASSLGNIGEAILEIAFERNWHEDVELPIFEEREPVVAFNGSPVTPPGKASLDFWHDPWQWYGDTKMQETDDADIWIRVFSFTARNLTGQMRANWQPSLNYHPPLKKKKKAARKRTRGKST
jgi:hypothetical protein